MLTKQDKSKPVALSVRVHPEVVQIVNAMAVWLDDSDPDYVVAEAIKEAAKDKKFQEWWANQKPEERAKLLPAAAEKLAKIVAKKKAA